MINNILIVCIGNICRSPMAEALFRQAFPEKEIISAGIAAQAGRPADEKAVRVMKEHGIDISTYHAKPLTEEMIRNADLVVTMDQEQRRYIERRFPSATGKVIRLGEFSEYDIGDPYQRDQDVFFDTYRLIAKGLDELAEQIALIA